MGTDAQSHTAGLEEAVSRVPRGRRIIGSTVLIRILAILLALVLLVTILGVIVVRRSFPQTAGELSVPGLERPVTVDRDASGVPFITASSAHDLFLAQGYVHAQDRFWEMDFRRHVTSGRLSELFGASQVPTDAFIRTLDWRGIAEKEVANLDPVSRSYYEAYADGVNAYLADRSPSEISLEYVFVGLQSGPVTIEKWTPADSVAWLKAMAWDLRSNLEDEIDRAILGQSLSKEQMADVFPAYPYDSRPTILGTGAEVVAPPSGSDDSGGEAKAGGEVVPAESDLVDLKQRLAELPQLLGRNSEDIGSNSWVVSGAHTSTGKPLLANDPHLSPAMPSVWYQVGLRCAPVTDACPFDVSGFSFSGLPGVIIGHNGDIAWGLTNLGPDVADLVVEKIEGNRVVRGTDLEPITERTETITVAKEEPRTIRIRSTDHGPIVSDLPGTYRDVLDASLPPKERTHKGPASRYRLALQWTALEPGHTAEAIFAIDRARNWDEFRAAASLFDVPAQNLVYADTKGHIGYQAPGRIPRRGTGDGMLPRQGWDRAQDWQGFYSFDELPSELDPDRGWIVTANNPVTRPGESVQLSDDFDYGDRADRITTMLEEAITTGPIDADTFATIQADTANPLAPHLLPVIADLERDGHLGGKANADARRGARMLAAWDGRDDADSAAAAYFNVLASTILSEDFAPKLPKGSPPTGGSHWYLVIEQQLVEPDAAWWTDEEVSGRDEAIVRALGSAWNRAEDLMGPEPVTWRWGTLHALTIRNASLGESEITAIEKLFNRGPYEVSGGSGVVDATGWDASQGFETDWVPSMRQIVDLDDLDRSRWINLTGASGHAFAEHYADQTEDWAAGRTRAWPHSPEAVERASAKRLTLTP